MAKKKRNGENVIDDRPDVDDGNETEETESVDAHELTEGMPTATKEDAEAVQTIREALSTSEHCPNRNGGQYHLWEHTVKQLREGKHLRRIKPGTENDPKGPIFLQAEKPHCRYCGKEA